MVAPRSLSTGIFIDTRHTLAYSSAPAFYLVLLSYCVDVRSVNISSFSRRLFSLRFSPFYSRWSSFLCVGGGRTTGLFPLFSSSSLFFYYYLTPSLSLVLCVRVAVFVRSVSFSFIFISSFCCCVRVERDLSARPVEFVHIGVTSKHSRTFPQVSLILFLSALLRMM